MFALNNNKNEYVSSLNPVKSNSFHKMKIVNSKKMEHKQFTWNRQINMITERGGKRVNILKFPTRRKLGLHSNIAMIFYKAYVVSIIDFECLFYGWASNSGSPKSDR